jgi:hypothetical protein
MTTKGLSDLPPLPPDVEKMWITVDKAEFSEVKAVFTAFL